MSAEYKVHAKKIITCLLSVGLILLVATQAAFAEDLTPAVVSDKPDYLPGETVTLRGSGWAGDPSVELKVDDVSSPTEPWGLVETIPVTGDGTFTYQFILPSVFIDRYQVTALGSSTARTAATTFSDCEPVVPNPDIILTKTAAELSFDSVGDVIHYTLTATNNGNTTIHNVMIHDPLLAVLLFSLSVPAVLEPGETLTATGIHIVNQHDLDIGLFYNLATASGNGPAPDCEPVTFMADECVPAIQNPDITLTKIAAEEDYDEVGDVIHYTLEAKNTGNVSLHGVSITDPLLGELSFSLASPAFLFPCQTLTATGTHTVTQADLDAGHIINTATVSGKGPAPDCETVSDTADEDVPAIQKPEISLMKIAAETNYDEVGDVIHYTLKAENTGNVTLHDVTITDPVLGTLLFMPSPPATLAPHEMLTATGIHIVTQADLDAGHFYNIGAADGLGPAPMNVPVGDTAQADIEAVQNPELTLTKAAAETNYDEVGDVIHYTIEAENTGNVTLHDVMIADPILGELVYTPGSPAMLAPGEVLSAAGTHTVTQADLDAGHFFNIAGAQGKGPAPSETPVADTADNNIPAVQNPEITIVKTTNGADGLFIPADADITWTYAVTNTGNVTLKNVVVTDSDLGAVGTVATLVPNARETMTMAGTAVVGLYENTGTVSASPPAGSKVTDSDDSSYFGAKPHILIVKTAKNITANGTAGDAVTGTAGDDFLYTLVVTNTGNVDLSDVIISDYKAAVGSAVTVDGTADTWKSGVGGIATLHIAKMVPDQEIIITYAFNTEPADPAVNRINIATVSAAAAYTVNDTTPAIVRAEDFAKVTLAAVMGAVKTNNVLGAVKSGESTNYLLAGLGTSMLLASAGILIIVGSRKREK